MFKSSLAIAGILLLITLPACGPTVTRPAPVERLMTASTPETTQAGAYHIGIGDDIEVKFFFTPELNDRMTVRPDGKVSLMFAQDIQAAGRTSEELADAIKQRISSHVKQTDLVVIVRSFASQKIYVAGEVGKPGPVITTGHENLLQIINDAGWITPLASRDEVFVVRRGTDGKDAIYPINFRRILSGEDMSQNVTLQAGDIVMVPPSDSTSADRWVDQNMRQMIPISSGAFFNVGR